MCAKLIDTSGLTGMSTADLEYMTTEQGSKLLTSGWWGVSRHPNYMCVYTLSWAFLSSISPRGDLLMGLAWSLPTGFDTPFTYFYVIYFAVLLIHRQRRDDERCQNKYARFSSCRRSYSLIAAGTGRTGTGTRNSSLTASSPMSIK